MGEGVAIGPVAVLGALALASGGRAAGLARARELSRRRLRPVLRAPEARRRWSRVGLVAAASAFGLASSGVVVAVGAMTIATVGPGLLATRRARAAARAEVDGLADAVEAVARALRAGVPPVEAIRAGARGAPPALAAGLAGVVLATERGVALSSAIDRWAEGADAVEAGAPLVAAAFAVHATAGGDPARSLAGVADTLHERRAVRREVRALSSQARLSASVIAVAPAAFAVLAAATDGRTADFLLHSPAGAGCLGAGIALDAAGWRWMDRITRSVA